MDDEQEFDEGDFQEMIHENVADSALDEQLLGLERWEYAWVLPADLDERGADRWRVTYQAAWHDGRMLMERKRLADDTDLQGLVG